MFIWLQYTFCSVVSKYKISSRIALYSLAYYALLMISENIGSTVGTLGETEQSNSQILRSSVDEQSNTSFKNE